MSALIPCVQRRHELLVRHTRLTPRLDGFAEGDVGEVLRMLKLIQFIDRDEYRRGLTLLGQHDTLVTTLSTGHEFVEMITGLWHRKRECHSSDATPGSRHFIGAARARDSLSDRGTAGAPRNATQTPSRAGTVRYGHRGRCVRM